MRIVVGAILLIVSFSAWAQSTISDADADADAKKVLAWRHECDHSNRNCWLEKIVSFKREKGVEQGGVAIAYDRVKNQPEFIAVIVPGDVPPDSGLLITFVDSVRKNGNWTLTPVGNFIDLNLSFCDKTSCQARIHPQIPNGPNLFNEIKRRRFVWVLFKRDNELERFIVPLSGVNAELAAIHVTR